MNFKDRKHAGKLLAEQLSAYKPDNPITKTKQIPMTKIPNPKQVLAVPGLGD